MNKEAPQTTLARAVRFARVDNRLWLMVIMSDGRLVAQPLKLYPTLLSATPAQRSAYRKIAGGIGFHWPALDLDLSVSGILAGSGEVKRASSRRSA